jgi:hypothetical protein
MTTAILTTGKGNALVFGVVCVFLGKIPGLAGFFAVFMGFF